MRSTTRREFLGTALATAATAGLSLKVGLDGELAYTDDDAAAFEPNAWIGIDAGGQVSLTVAKAEMGQGVRTSLSMILAEELEADWHQVRIVTPTPGPDVNMRTSGSGAVLTSWLPLRRAGAAARAMLIEAAARSWRVPGETCRAENGDIVHPPSGRRLGFGELVALARTLPIPEDPPLKRSEEFRLVGTPRRRVDGGAIVSGRAVYGLDCRVPGMLRAVVRRPPVVGGRLARWDGRSARARAGVRALLPISSGLAVVADDTWTAMAASEAVDVTWDEGPNREFDSRAHRETLAAAARRGGRVSRDEGDLEHALSSASGVLDVVYEYAFQAHAPLEPMNAAAHAEEGRCTIWAPTQAANQVQEAVAELLGLPADRVSVHVPLLGGGFGRRLGVEYAVEAAEISRATGGPVQVVWTRADDMRHGFFHPASAHRMRGAVGPDGRPVAFAHTVADSYLTLFGPPDREDPDLYEAWGAYDNPYAFPSIHTELTLVDSPVPSGAWRAVQYPPGVFARESFLDELAHAGRQDPLELRLALLREPRQAPLRLGSIDRWRLRRVVEHAAEKAGWGGPLPPGRGRGIAANVYHRRTCVAQVAEVSLDETGGLRVHRIVCSVDCGTAVNPLGIEGQVHSGILWGLSALRSEITFRRGRVEQTNYHDYPVFLMPETPEIETHVVPSPERPSGLGEMAVPPVAPAVMNALFALTGRRVRRLPFRPEGRS